MTSGLPPEAEAYTQLMRQAWEHWQSGVAGSMGHSSAAGEAQLERMLTALKSYFDLLESLNAQIGSGDPTQQWRSILGSIFGSGQPFSQAFGDASTSAGGGPQAWMDAFAQVLTPMQSAGQAFLGMPAFGMAREHQERAQQLARDMVDYREQMRRYNQLLARAGRRGAERFEARLADRTEPGRQVESLRALYDLWVDAAEDGFQEVALSPEWREVYGALVNAQMRVRAGVQRQVEGSARELGMPTRTEVDTLGKRLHDLRREVRELKERLDGGGAAPTATTAGPTPPPAAAATRAARKPRSTGARRRT